MTEVSGDLDQWPTRDLQLHVDVHAPDARRFEAVARSWLVETRGRLATGIWRLVEAGDAGPQAAGVGRIGIPSMGRGNWSRPYTVERFEGLLGSLSQRGRDALWAAAAPLGRVGMDECCSAYVSLTVADDSPEWLTFQARLVFRTATTGLAPNGDPILG
jgi:hypothetical protein